MITEKVLNALDARQKKILDRWVAKDTVKFQRVGEKTVICVLVLKNGFEIVGSSACVNPAYFNYNIGRENSFKDAINKLGNYAAFYIQERDKDTKEE